MQPPPAATAAHTDAHAGQGVTVTDGVAAELAVTLGDGDALAAGLGDGGALRVALGDTETLAAALCVPLADELGVALALADGVGLHASQQSVCVVELPAHWQEVLGQASRLQYAPLHTLSDRRRGAAAEYSSPASRRRRVPVHE